MVPETPAPSDPSTISPPSVFAQLPRTSWLWIALVLFGLVSARILPARRDAIRSSAPSELKLSGADFSKYTQAETQFRLGLGLRESSTLVSGPSIRSDSKKQIDESLVKAADLFRELARSTDLPGIDRRALIAQNVAGRPFDPAQLDDLKKDLTAAKTPPGKIDEELSLWRFVYGGEKTRPGFDLPAHLAGLNLGKLERPARIALYQRLGEPTAVTAQSAALKAESLRYLVTSTLLNIGLFLCGLIGVGLLIWFGIAACRQRWNWLGRVPRPEPADKPSLLWGDCVDAFLFYLAVHTNGSLLLLPLRAMGLNTPLLPTITVIGIVTDLSAVAYMIAAARRRGVGLGAIGLTTRGAFWANIGYGILTQLTLLPMMLVLGIIAHTLFRNNPNVTPNPVLPLLAGSGSSVDRALIFALAAICAPFFEEFFFRGVLYTGLRQRLNWVGAAALSGMVFAMLHPMQDWLPIFALGVGFAIAREMRQSLVPGMVGHFLQNSMTFITLSLLFS